MYATTQNLTYISAKSSTVFILKRKDYERIADTLDVHFRKLPIFKTIIDRDNMSTYCTLVKCPAGSTIINTGERKGNFFYVVSRGSIMRLSDRSIYMEQKYFGEEGFFPGNDEAKGNVWESDFIAQEPVILLVVSAEGYNSPLFESVRKFLTNQPMVRLKRNSSTGSSSSNSNHGLRRSPSNSSLSKNASAASNASADSATSVNSQGVSRRRGSASNRDRRKELGRARSNSSTGSVISETESVVSASSAAGLEREDSISQPGEEPKKKKKRRRKKKERNIDAAVASALSSETGVMETPGPTLLVGERDGNGSSIFSQYSCVTQAIVEHLDSISCGLSSLSGDGVEKAQTPQQQQQQQ